MGDITGLNILNVTFGFVLFLMPFLLPTAVLRLPLLNPFTVLCALQAPIYIAKNFFGPAFNFNMGLADPWFNYSMFVQNIYLAGYVLVFFMALVFFNRVDMSKLNSDVCRVVSVFSARDCLRISFLFFMISFFFLFYLMQKTIGFVEWASNPRLGYQFHRVGNGHLYALSIFFSSFGFILLVLSRVKLSALFIYGFMYCLYSYLYGSKMIIFEFFTFFLISLWLHRFRYFKLMLVIGGGGAFLLMLINYGSFELEQIFKYFDYHVNSAMFYEYLSSNDAYFNGTIFLTGFWEYVPRALYPDKPFAYGDILIREIFWPGAAQSTHTPGMAGPVGLYGDFGLSGVALFSFFQVSAMVHAFFVIFAIKNYHGFSDKYGVGGQVDVSFLYVISFASVFAPCFLIYIPFPMSMFFIFAIFVFMFCLKQFFKAFKA